MIEVFKCPVCGLTLNVSEKSYFCENKHCFDMAKEGYVNLLLANQKKSNTPGDDKAMVESRLNFLNKGFYNKLADAVFKSISEKTVFTENRTILDLGCGVGFYTAYIADAMKKNGYGNIGYHGIDISKPAIQKAAKLHTFATFCIGSSFNLPYQNEVFDAVFSIFAPFEMEEIFRTMKKGSSLIVVRPGAFHLKELAELIYGKFELQGNSVIGAQSEFVSEKSVFDISNKILLDNAYDILNLLTMTPYYWHLNEDKLKLISSLKQLSVTLDFKIHIFKKID